MKKPVHLLVVYFLTTSCGVGMAGEPDVYSVEHRYCGRNAACLLARLVSDKPVENAEIDLYLPVNSKGSSMKDMAESLQSLGIPCQVGKCDATTLRSLKMPAIALIHAAGNKQQTHFVVIVEIDGDNVIAIDGTRLTYMSYSPVDWEQRWEGHLIYLPESTSASSQRWGWIVGSMSLAIAFVILIPKPPWPWYGGRGK